MVFLFFVFCEENVDRYLMYSDPDTR